MNMYKLNQPIFLGSAAILGTLLMFSVPVTAQEQISSTESFTIDDTVTNLTDESDSLNVFFNLDNGDYSLAQVNSVFQFRDVSQTNWAFPALRNLVENYGCLAGYPDRTYRGDQPLTRNEFAAGLNACLSRVAIPPSTTQVPINNPPPAVVPQNQNQESISEMINRAFYSELGDFFDQVSLLGQANLIFGFKSFPRGSYPENLMNDEGKTISILLTDILKQQNQGAGIVRTRDLANPFGNSLSDTQQPIDF